MKLLIVAPYFYPKVGGLENYVWNISKGLKKKYGWEIVVITSNHSGNAYKEEVIDGIKIYRLPYWFRFSNTPINFGWFIDISKIFNNEKPDLVNAHAPVPFIADVANIVAADKHIPYVLTYHAGSMKKKIFLYDILIGLYEKFFLKKLIDDADKIICFHSEFIKRYCSSNKINIVAPGVDTSVFKYSSKKRKNIILYVGKIEKSAKYKGLSVLIDAISILKKDSYEFLLKIIGEGDAVNEYKHIINVKKLESFVKFPGKLSSSKLAKEVQSAKVLILPSVSDAESFGMVLTEAMSCGTPVIGSNIGGIPRVIDDNLNGLLFESGNEIDLANKTKLFLNNDQLVSKYGKKGFKKVTDNFTWDIAVSKYFSIFNDYKK